MTELYNVESFDEQFAHKEIMSVGARAKAFLRVTDLQPETDSEGTLPILFVPSVLGNPNRLAPAMKEFWDSGKRTLIVEHPKGSTHTKRELANIDRPHGIPLLELGRAALLNMVLQVKDIPKVDVVSQCEGAINATAFTYMHPERVRSLIVVNPSGIGEDTVSRHVQYFATRTLRDVSKKVSGMLHKDDGQDRYRPLLHHSDNPLFYVRCGYAAVRSRIDPLLNQIEDAGVRVGILKGSTDRLYPPERIEQYIDINAISKYDVIEDPRSGHSPLINLPEASVRAILTMQQEICE